MRHENAKLKQLVADLTLDRHILQEIVRKNCEVSGALHPGRIGSDDIPAEPTPGREGHSGAHLDGSAIA